MQVILRPTGDTSCELIETTPATSATFPLPIAKDTLVTALRAFLTDPESRDGGSGPVRLERRRDGIAIAYGSGAFFVKYAYLLPLVLEPAA